MKRAPWETTEIESGSSAVRVFSPSNIALAKYWGKRNLSLNLPTNSSLSVTLKDFGSSTTVEFNSKFQNDELYLNGERVGASGLTKVTKVLNNVRNLADSKLYARIQSQNNFPTAAGLASSASGLSAVAFGAVNALKLDLSLQKISEIARIGSGSASRSLFSGFVEWKRGELADGSDSIASSIATLDHWPFDIFIAIANQKAKTHASTGGMESTRLTSPYFNEWVSYAQISEMKIKDAVLERNFNELASEAEANCIKMHASAMAANPPILYWQAQTISLMNAVWEMRKEGIEAFFTIDAGPNVVVLVNPKHSSQCFERLKKISDIQILQTSIGEGTRCLP